MSTSGLHIHAYTCMHTNSHTLAHTRAHTHYIKGRININKIKRSEVVVHAFNSSNLKSETRVLKVPGQPGLQWVWVGTKGMAMLKKSIYHRQSVSSSYFFYWQSIRLCGSQTESMKLFPNGSDLKVMI